VKAWFLRVLEPLVDMLSTALLLLMICGLAALLSLLGCRASSQPPVLTPVILPPPSCVVVLGPPPVPPMSFREMANMCRGPEGRELLPEELCLSTAEATELRRFAAQSSLYAMGAYAACRLSEPGTEEGVKVMR
jgi:hypothetical protein